MSVDVDVAVVGSGPAALAAAVELRRHRIGAVVIAGPSADLSPRFLLPRAQQELVVAGLALPSGYPLAGASLAEGPASRPMHFACPILAVDGRDWTSYLRLQTGMLGHEVLAGCARMVDAERGLLELEHAGRETRHISARTIIWAAGAPPAEFGRRTARVVTVHRTHARAQAAPVLQLRLAGGLNGRGGQLSRTMPSADAQFNYTTRWWTEPPPDLPDAIECLQVHGNYASDLSSWGRVLLVGGAVGLANRFTGEGISYALASGRLAGRAAAASGGRERYISWLDSQFGRGQTDRVAAERRHTLTVKALEGALRAPTAARKKMVGLVVDLQDGESLGSVGLDRSNASLPRQVIEARTRVQVATAREAANLWFAAAPSLARVPSMPDVRLSDVLIACVGDAHVAAPRTALAGAAVDLMAGSIGFLASAVGDDEAGEDRSWVEIASIAAHDALACRAVRIAAQAGTDVLDVCLAWMESIVRLRQRQRSTPAQVDGGLYEVAFLLSTRVAAVMRGEFDAGALLLDEVGRALGRSYLLGEERRLVEGARSRLGLDREETMFYGLGTADGASTLDQRLVAQQEQWDETVQRAGWLFSGVAQDMLHSIHDSAMSGPQRNREGETDVAHDNDGSRFATWAAGSS